MDTSPAERTDSAGTSPTDRIAQVIVLVSIAFVVLVGIGFGAKTSCTTRTPSDSPACDAIDAWAWAGLLAVVAVSTLGAARRQRFSVLLALVGVVLAVVGVGMLSVTPS